MKQQLLHPLRIILLQWLVEDHLDADGVPNSNVVLELRDEFHPEDEAWLRPEVV
jgi:hypothetical protein